jgi:hypothetical protein
MSERGTSTESQPVSYAADIRPLFRASDRAAMEKAFDLWSYTDVSAHAAQIAEKLRAGTMPCDGPWPAGNVALFDDWVSGGSRP